jgi:hypothetical protein
MQQSSTLVNIAMQKKQFINAAKQQTQNCQSSFVSANAQQDIAELSQSKLR